MRTTPNHEPTQFQPATYLPVRRRQQGYQYRTGNNWSANPGIMMIDTGEMLTEGEYVERLKTEPMFIMASDAESYIEWLLDAVPREQLQGWGRYADPWAKRGQRAVFDRFRINTMKGKHDPAPIHVLTDPACWGKRERIMEDFDTSAELQQDIDEWCRTEDLQVRGSPGGLAVQYLRDPRFYPEPRRKVPWISNDIAREHIPGNHYQISEQASQEHSYAQVFAVDQVRAWHNIASQIPLPHANDLYRRGTYRQPERMWGCHKWNVDRLEHEHGLVAAEIILPDNLSQWQLPNYAVTQKWRMRWLFTNELDWYRENGAEIIALYGGITSRKVDEGLPKFAHHALAQKEPARWLKATLNATYSCLGARSYQRPQLMLHGKHNREVWIARIRVQVHEFLQKFGALTGNVIQLGMIQAEQRKRSMQMARAIELEHVTDPLAIYADSVIVGPRKPQIVPDGWKIKETHHNVKLGNAQLRG